MRGRGAVTFSSSMVVALVLVGAAALRADLLPLDDETRPAPVAEDVPIPTPPASVDGIDPRVVAACPEIGPADADPNAVEAKDDLRSKVVGAMARGEMFLALLLVLVAGFLTALTPCVFPLIPITLAILGARQTTPLRGFALAATYTAGMVVLYAGLGTAFAAAGFLAGSLLQSSLVTSFVALICFAMAASMFGAFEIALPASLQNRLSQVGGGGFRGAFLMGLVAGVIAAPCTGPVLSVILTLIATDGDVLQGALLMVFYALGIGLPFLVLGTFSQAVARMPKSGPWMEAVKSVFGMLMLTAGLYYIQFAIPFVAELFAEAGRLGPTVGGALVVAGVVLGAFHLSFKYTTRPEQIRKGAGVVVTATGLFVALGWVMSTPEPDHGTASGEQIAWAKVGNEPDAVARFDALLASAKQTCKPVMIDFFAEWCAACKELDRETYVAAPVIDEAARFLNIKIDGTNEEAFVQTLYERYGIQGLPTVVFIGSDGKPMQDPRVTGFLGPAPFLNEMKRVP